MKVQIECSENELNLINKALDFYSRVGTGQFREIVDHPTFQRFAEDYCRPKRDPQVGDNTPQGEILKIKENRVLINGSIKDEKWSKIPEWKDIKDVKLSTNYNLYHTLRNIFEKDLCRARDIFTNENLDTKGNWGIYNDKVDNSCVLAFHLHQQIRHELWKVRNEKSNVTVDSFPADACQIKGLPIPDFDVKVKK